MNCMDLDDILEVNNIYAKIHGWDGSVETAVHPKWMNNRWVFSFCDFPLTFGVYVGFNADGSMSDEYAYKFSVDNVLNEWSYTRFSNYEPFQEHSGTFKFEL